MANKDDLKLSNMTSARANELQVNQMSYESIPLSAKEFQVCLTGSCKLQAQSTSFQGA